MSDKIFKVTIDGVLVGSEIMKALEKINYGTDNTASILGVKCAIINAQVTNRYDRGDIYTRSHSDGVSGFLQRNPITEYTVELDLIEIATLQPSILR